MDSTNKQPVVKSPQSLYAMALETFINSDNFKQHFEFYIKTLPKPIKRDAMTMLLATDRVNPDDDGLYGWRRVTMDVLKTLVFVKRSNHQFECDRENVKIVIQSCRNGCKTNNMNLNIPVSPFDYEPCLMCNFMIPIKYIHMFDDELKSIIYDFRNWCQNCCTQPLFDIAYMSIEDVYEMNKDCLKCALDDCDYKSDVIDKVCSKHNVQEVYDRYGLDGVIDLL
ncbi:hypothetical protein [Orgyia pseudotsugata single capsid nuclopolyhedrovirus]|nr:hypothetical protein [Orgyia pseudotsugata single capsid nuclopolyhedrovirus]